MMTPILQRKTEAQKGEIHSNRVLLSENMLEYSGSACLAHILLPIHTNFKMSLSNMIQLSIILWWVKYGHKFFATLPL